MIKEKHLVPGRMLACLHSHDRIVMNHATGIGHRSFEDVWVPCMVVSYFPTIDRRHAKSEARRSGWEVLVYWFDDRRERLQRVFIHNDAFSLKKWKLAGW